MIPGVTAVAEEPVASLPSALDLSTPSPFRTLLADPDAEFTFLMVAGPLNGGGTFIRLSDKGFHSTPSDTPANQTFSPRLLTALKIGVVASRGGEFSGRSEPAVGDIVVANPDGSLDSDLTFGWDGREIEVLAGGPDFTLEQFETVFKGTADGLTWDERQILIRLRDRQLFLNKPVQENLYSGAGLLDGNSEVKSKPKPLTYGVVNNLEPLLIDTTSLVYQIHDGSIQAVDEVRDQGVALTDDGDLTDVYTWTPVAGKYVTNLFKGVMRLGASPAGRITADVQGDNAGLGIGGFINTTATIIRRIVTTRLGDDDLTDPDDIDVPAFNTVDSLFSGEIGLHIPAVARQTSSILDEMMVGAVGFWTFTRKGRLTIGLVRAPQTASRTLTNADNLLPGVRRLPTVAPSWRRRVGYEPMQVTQDPDELAGAVTDANVAKFGAKHRFVSVSDTTVRDKHALARDAETLTLLNLEADASALAQELQDTFGPDRDRYQWRVPRALLRFWVGDVHTLQISRFGLDAGKNFLILGITEDASKDSVTVEYWG